MGERWEEGLGGGGALFLRLGRGGHPNSPNVPPPLCAPAIGGGENKDGGEGAKAASMGGARKGLGIGNTWDL